MSNELFTEVACPNCLAPIDLRDHGSSVTCDVCNSQFLLNGHLCPQCGAYSQEDLAVCRQCSYPLKRSCAQCDLVNWSGDGHCAKCDAPLDLLESITNRHKNAYRTNSLEQRERLRALKMKEELAARERMAEFLEIEEARQSALRARQAQLKQRERRLLLFLFGMGAFFLIIVALFYILVSI